MSKSKYVEACLNDDYCSCLASAIHRFYVDCDDGQHEIVVKPNGHIVFTGHLGVPMTVLAQEQAMRVLTPPDCRLFATHVLHALSASRTGEPQEQWRGYLSKIVRTRTERYANRQEQAFREPPEREAIRDKICKDLQTATGYLPNRLVIYRGSLAASVPLEAAISQSLENVARGSRGREVHLNGPKWARAHLRLGGSLVKEVKGSTGKRKAGREVRIRFVTEIVKDVSENECLVSIYKKTTRGRYTISKASVRRNHLGQWHIHKWFKKWPWE